MRIYMKQSARFAAGKKGNGRITYAAGEVYNVTADEFERLGDAAVEVDKNDDPITPDPKPEPEPEPVADDWAPPVLDVEDHQEEDLTNG